MAKKQAKPKTITIMVDTGWPLSPREIEKKTTVKQEGLIFKLSTAE